MSAVILDYRADNEIVNNITKLGIDIIPSFKSLQVSKPLSGHPDMQICKLPGGVYVCSDETYSYYQSALKNYNIKLFKGESTLKSNYPQDVAYNVAWIGEWAVHNTLYTDSQIELCLNSLNIKILNVNQGYSKCNICTVSDNAIITSDAGIKNALTKQAIDCLQIREGHIDIFRWDYGFIGGASGKLDNSTLAFCGDISLHPDYDKISDFCAKYNVNCASLSKKRLTDLGSIIIIDNSTTV